MNNDLKIKAVIQIERIIYFKDDWGTVLASVDKDKTPPNEFSKITYANRNGYITCVGNMARPELGDSYNIVAELVDNPKYGYQYNILQISSTITIDTSDASGQRKYLTNLFTENQVNEMYETLENPFDIFVKKDIEKLVQVKGIGFVTANAMINKFENNYDIAKMMLQLEKYELTTNMMKKLLNHYKQAELAIQAVTENPYILAETINGIGFKKADEIALAGGLGEYSTERIGAFVLFYLNNKMQNGFNYITSEELIDAIVENIGEEVPDFNIGEAMRSIEQQLWYNDEKTLIGLRKAYNLEYKIAKELLRIRDGENDFKIDNWEQTIKHKEVKQGWQYTEQQKLGIQLTLNNNVIVVTGKAGTGKTSSVDGMLSVLVDYIHAMCALSGKASSRLAEITGEEGYTIHRLLDYPNMEGKNKFGYHDENFLPYDIIIVDEVSMIGGQLFYYLIRAIKSGTKLILLGDCGQLESIGECNILADLIASQEIPSIEFDKIHRQAQKSAIITESLKARSGIQIIEKDWAGEEIRGELQDLTLCCYSDKSNTFIKTMEYFQSSLLQVESILDLQIICPVKDLGDACTWNINNTIQELYNPPQASKQEYEIYSQGKTFIIREGDKIINRKNNYRSRTLDGTSCPIFNGNIGILNKITEDDNGEPIFYITFQNIGKVVFDKETIKNVQLGYAITGHSSQGSQWERIIIALDYSSYALLSREWVYTAMTRAQKHCILVAQNSALRYAISQEKVSEKTTFLVQILYDLTHPKLVF